MLKLVRSGQLRIVTSSYGIRAFLLTKNNTIQYGDLKKNDIFMVLCQDKQPFLRGRHKRMYIYTRSSPYYTVLMREILTRSKEIEYNSIF